MPGVRAVVSIMEEAILTLIDSTVDKNTVAQGGGIVIIGTGTLTAINSTISDNTAQAGTGGGILDLSGGANSAGSEATAVLINTTIANNKAQGTENGESGSFGLHNGYGGGLLQRRTAKVSLNNTIIANNTEHPPRAMIATPVHPPFTHQAPWYRWDITLTQMAPVMLTAVGDQPSTNPSLVHIIGKQRRTLPKHCIEHRQRH